MARFKKKQKYHSLFMARLRGISCSFDKLRHEISPFLMCFRVLGSFRAEIREWASGLISGQSTTGTIKHNNNYFTGKLFNFCFTQVSLYARDILQAKLVEGIRGEVITIFNTVITNSEINGESIILTLTLLRAGI